VPPDRIVEIAYSYRAAKALMSAVELDLFTTLSAGPLASETLVRRTGLHGRGARDFFDALVALRLLERDERDRYSNTAMADAYLDRTKPAYLGSLIEHINRVEYHRWQSLTQALRTGKPQTGVGSSGNYPARYSDHGTLEAFVRGMTSASLPAAAALARRFPWHEYATFVDIGTAQGAVPVVIAGAQPHLNGGGFDLPPVEPAFCRYVAEHGLSDRLRFHAGNFFSDPLPSADVLIMGRVLHNWDLPTKQMLLQKAYRALPEGGAIIVYERLIDNARQTNASGLLSSLNMLVMTSGGFDFTGADCMGWMREAGFYEMRIEALSNDHSMVVGHK
jgi:hypothetical protein